MKRLWSPWRHQYINSFKDEKSDIEACFFCEAISNLEVSKKNLVVYFSNNAFVIMNKFPYNNGHLLIAPTTHYCDLHQLDSETLKEIMDLQVKSTLVLSEIYKPHGFNIGANLGRAAGAGVPGHLHYHVLPRWNGDTNFLPIISETKVLSETLEDSFDKISEQFRKLF